MGYKHFKKENMNYKDRMELLLDYARTTGHLGLEMLLQDLENDIELLIKNKEIELS